MLHNNVLGRPVKKLRVLAAVVLAMLTMALLPMPALADPAAPDNLQIDSVRGFRHLVEDDDLLIVFHYNIHYAGAPPAYPASQLFVFRLLDTDGITYLGATVPYPYYNTGYDYGIAAFYFTAATAPAWGDPYVVRISGSPEYYSSPPVSSRTIVTSDYCALTTSDEQQVALGNYVIDVARLLEVNWSTTLIYSGDLGTVLNTTGETYFRGAISSLQVMAPQVFATQTSTPEFTEAVYTEAQGQAYENRFAGTWIGNALENAGDALRIKWNVITGIIVLLLIAGFAVLDQWQFGTVKPAMIEGAIIMVGATVLGWWAYAILAIIATLFAFFIGYVWFFRHG